MKRYFLLSAIFYANASASDLIASSNYCVKVGSKMLCTFDDPSSCLKTAKAIKGDCVVNTNTKRSTRSLSYKIEKSINDEKFLVNGELFSAQTYCFGFYEGDQVKFIEGSAFGACATAKILNLRSGEVCDLWCE